MKKDKSSLKEEKLLKESIIIRRKVYEEVYGNRNEV